VRRGTGRKKREKKGVENRLKEVKLLERNEKEERRKNIIIRGLEIKEGKGERQWRKYWG